MANNVWADWFDAVLPEVPGCPTVAATYAIHHAAREFFERSLVWRMTIPAIDAVANQMVYAVPNPTADLKFVRLLSGRYQTNQELYAKRPDQLRELYFPTDWRSQVGTPLYFTTEAPTTISFVPAPAASDTPGAGSFGQLFAAVSPTFSTGNIDSTYYTEYFDDIKNGALRRLFESVKKPYSNPELAQLYGQKFDESIGAKEYEMFRGAVPSHSRTKTHFF